MAGGKGLTVATLAGKRAAQAFKEQSTMYHIFSIGAGWTNFITMFLPAWLHELPFGQELGVSPVLSAEDGM